MIISTSLSRKSGQGTSMSSRNGKKTICSFTCFNTDKNLFESKVPKWRAEERKDQSQGPESAHHNLKVIREQIAVRQEEKRREEQGVGQDLENAVRQFQILKQGDKALVDIENDKQKAANREKSDSETFLNKMVQSINKVQDKRKKEKRSAVDLRFRVCNRYDNVHSINYQKTLENKVEPGTYNPKYQFTDKAIVWSPDHSRRCYEKYDGAFNEMPPTKPAQSFNEPQGFDYNTCPRFVQQHVNHAFRLRNHIPISSYLQNRRESSKDGLRNNIYRISSPTNNLLQSDIGSQPASARSKNSTLPQKRIKNQKTTKSPVQVDFRDDKVIHSKESESFKTDISQIKEEEPQEVMSPGSTQLKNFQSPKYQIAEIRTRADGYSPSVNDNYMIQVSPMLKASKSDYKSQKSQVYQKVNTVKSFGSTAPKNDNNVAMYNLHYTKTDQSKNDTIVEKEGMSDPQQSMLQRDTQSCEEQEQPSVHQSQQFNSKNKVFNKMLHGQSDFKTKQMQKSQPNFHSMVKEPQPAYNNSEVQNIRIDRYGSTNDNSPMNTKTGFFAYQKPTASISPRNNNNMQSNPSQMIRGKTHYKTVFGSTFRSTASNQQMSMTNKALSPTYQKSANKTQNFFQQPQLHRKQVKILRSIEEMPKNLGARQPQNPQLFRTQQSVQLDQNAISRSLWGKAASREKASKISKIQTSRQNDVPCSSTGFHMEKQENILHSDVAGIQTQFTDKAIKGRAPLMRTMTSRNDNIMYKLSVVSNLKSEHRQ